MAEVNYANNPVFKNYDPAQLVKQSNPEGRIVPLISVEGTAYECGQHYAEIVMSKYPGFREYLDLTWDWRELPAESKKMIEARAPHLLDVYRGVSDVCGPPQNLQPTKGGQAPFSKRTEKGASPPGCTSFSVHGKCTLDGNYISGQTKDTGLNRVQRYIVLRMKIKDAPAILALAYPGEILGYGFWSTGMSLFRNSLYVSNASERGLRNIGSYMALSSKSIHEVVELAQKYGVRGMGNQLITDPQGEAVSIEASAAGPGFIYPKNGICTHANHAEAEKVRDFEKFAFPTQKEESQWRMHGLWQRLNEDNGRLTPQKVFMCLADHTIYPRGICKHLMFDEICTTAAVVVEPTRGKLHVVLGQPCCNWPVTYALSDQ